ncbi:DUF4388 domain-containing protein [Chloroflexia bacterium SDU3-3]|nr:DUF4388 domain-containing protein [Chloroflexia bacterium SDU3-3]
MQLESTLAQFPLPELLAMIAGSSVTGCLEIGEAAPGRLYFRDGKPYHAATDTDTGVAAFCQLFLKGDAPFRFTAGTAIREESLWQSADELIAFAQKNERSWKRVQRMIPSFDLVPVLTQPSANAVRLQDTSWGVLSAIDGHRSINEIAEHLGQLALDVAAALCDLHDQGAVRLIAARPRPARPEPAARSTHSQGFFGRIMASAGEYQH